MNTLTDKACEKYTEEDFRISAEFIKVDEETGEGFFDLTTNPRCNYCWHRDECVNRVMSILAKKFGLDDEDIQVDGSGYN